MAESNIILTLSESLNFTQTALEGLRKAVGLNSIQFNSLTATAKLVADGVKEANAIQKKSLAIESTLAQLTAGNTKALGNLAGGFYENTQSLLDLRRAGFEKLNPATTQLATVMRNTGQSSEGLIRLNKLLFNQGGLTEGSLNSLSEELAYTSTAYNITTTDLIGAVEQLSGKMATFGQLGIAGPLSKSVTELTGRMGAQFKDTIGNFASVLADPATSSSLLQRLGLLDIARDIRSGALSPSQMTEKLAEAIKIGSAQTQSLTGGAGGELGEVFTALLGIAGGEGGLGQMAMQLDRGDLKPGGPEVVISQQMSELGIIFSEMLEPIKMMTATVLPPIVELLKKSLPVLQFLAATIIPTLIGLLTTFMAATVVRFAISTGQWIADQVQGKALLAAMGALTGAMWASVAGTARGGPIGMIIGAVVGIAAMAVSISKLSDISEERLSMEKDAFHNEQRRQQMDVASTNSFLAMAKAISSDAGIAMAFRPDLLDSLRRDEVARSVITYLEEIAGGIATPAPTEVGLIIGANS